MGRKAVASADTASDVSGGAPTPVRRLRSDAAANRERVLAAAVTTILREGQHVPISTIAAEAGVGVGTLYRRYPNREALFEALQIRAYGIVVDTLDDILERTETGIRSLEHFLDRTIAHRTQLVLPFHGGPDSSHPEVLRLRRTVGQRMATLLRRGRADGTIRADLRVNDVIVFGAMLAQPLPTVADWDRTAHQQKRLFLRGARP